MELTFPALIALFIDSSVTKVVVTIIPGEVHVLDCLSTLDIVHTNFRRSLNRILSEVSWSRLAKYRWQVDNRVSFENSKVAFPCVDLSKELFICQIVWDFVLACLKTVEKV